jgi:hypothetical protein
MRSLLAVMALGAAACGPNLQSLRTRAAFDLQCNQQVDIVDIDKRTKGVVACGKQATYVENCQVTRWGGGLECTWIRNSEAAAAAASPAAPAPAAAPSAAN